MRYIALFTLILVAYTAYADPDMDVTEQPIAGLENQESSNEQAMDQTACEQVLVENEDGTQSGSEDQLLSNCQENLDSVKQGITQSDI